MKRILVVDDDKNIVLGLSVRLRSEGYDVDHAHDGVSATAAAMKEPPDLILLDISMPAGGGFTVMKRLQDSAATMSVPIIIMTASKKEGLLEQALKNGARAFFEKPYVTEELLAVIEATLTRPMPMVDTVTDC